MRLNSNIFKESVLVLDLVHQFSNFQAFHHRTKSRKVLVVLYLCVKAVGHLVLVTVAESRIKMGSIRTCAVCQSPASKVCSACHTVTYCSSEHQKLDWKSHKNSCCPYKIEKNETLGRYVVAVRNIPKGTIILTEEPLVVGPKVYSPPICLGCHRKVDGTYFCSKCGFPMCSAECEAVSPVFTFIIYHVNSV